MFNIQEIEEMEFCLSSASEWDRAEARQLGIDNPERAWILTDRDVWHANPFYVGQPVPHPEDDAAFFGEFDVSRRQEVPAVDDQTSVDQCGMEDHSEIPF